MSTADHRMITSITSLKTSVCRHIC